MPRIQYRDLRLGRRALETIGIVGAMIEEYRSKGLSLTVRQIHYQMVSRDIMPNTAATYNHVQGAVNKGRLCGLLDWEAIEDRGRNLMGLKTQTSPAHAIARTLKDYRLDLWADQEWRPEVWIEKQALEGVIGGYAMISVWTSSRRRGTTARASSGERARGSLTTFDTASARSSSTLATTTRPVFT